MTALARRTVLAGLLLLAARPASAADIVLASATSVDNSGLLAAILPRFTAATGIGVRVLALGTGQALAVTARGDADLVLLPGSKSTISDLGHLRAQGWDVPDAQGNFVWLPTGEQTDAVAAHFAENDLVVRPFSGDGIRISVGEEASIGRVLEVAQAAR